MTESKISPPLSETYDEVLRKIAKLNTTDRKALVSRYIKYTESNPDTIGFIMYADHYIEGEFLEYGEGLVEDLRNYFEGDILAFNRAKRN